MFPIPKDLGAPLKCTAKWTNARHIVLNFVFSGSHERREMNAGCGVHA